MMNFESEIRLIVEVKILTEAEFTGAVDVPEAKQKLIDEMVDGVMNVIRNRG
jgi:hypothetical protein